MPQQVTDHPPLRLPELPLDQQILVRLDEIIGLIDRLGHGDRRGSIAPCRRETRFPGRAVGRGGGAGAMMPPLRSDTVFLLLLVAILLVAGTATVENFWYWKMELSADGASWTPLYRQESPVNGGRLMEFNTTTVPRGQYRLRLTVVKRDGNYPGPCETVVSL